MALFRRRIRNIMLRMVRYLERARHGSFAASSWSLASLRAPPSRMWASSSASAPGVLLWVAVIFPPHCRPDQTDHTNNEENRVPRGEADDQGDNRKRDDCPDAEPGIPDAGGKGAFTDGEPGGHHFGSAARSRALTDSEQEPAANSDQKPCERRSRTVKTDHHTAASEKDFRGPTLSTYQPAASWQKS